MTEGEGLVHAWLTGAIPEALVALVVFVVCLSLSLAGGVAAAFGPRILGAAVSQASEMCGALPPVVTLFVARAIRPDGGLLEVGAVLAIVSGFTASRGVRAEALQLAREDFIVSLRALGISNARLVRKHALLHLSPSAFAHAATSAAALLTLDASFAFLGLGSTPGSWGSLLARGALGGGLASVLLPAGSTLALTLFLLWVAERARHVRDEPPRLLSPDSAFRLPSMSRRVSQ